MSDANKNDLLKYGWEEKEYSIATKDGFESVRGMAKNVFAVREHCHAMDKTVFEFCWGIDHMPTGRVIAIFDQKHHAIGFIQIILDSKEWSETPEDVRETQNFPTKLLEKMKFVRDEFHSESNAIANLKMQIGL